MLTPYNRNAVCVECENRIGTNSSTRDWNTSESVRKYLQNVPKKQDAKSYRKRHFWALHIYCGNY